MYYADYDEDTQLYCVFHTEHDGHAFSSWAYLREAMEDADRRNMEVLQQKLSQGKRK